MDKKKIIKVSLATIAMLAFMLISAKNYMYNNGLSGKYINTEPKEGQIKVACIGDSITYGHGISDWTKNSYPVLLQGLLGEDYHVANFGSSGACVNPDGDQPYVSRAVYQAAIEYDADIIVFMMGTNDAKPENWTNPQEFMDDYVALLDSLKVGSKETLIYIVPPAEAYYSKDCDPDTGIASYDIQPAKIDEIVQAIKMYVITSSYWMEMIDVHSLTEAHPEWFEVDGIHPDNDGAKAIAELIAEAIQK